MKKKKNYKRNSKDYHNTFENENSQIKFLDKFEIDKDFDFNKYNLKYS